MTRLRFNITPKVRERLFEISSEDGECLYEDFRAEGFGWANTGNLQILWIFGRGIPKPLKPRATGRNRHAIVDFQVSPWFGKIRV
jgi:hypothetical protein